MSEELSYLLGMHESVAVLLPCGSHDNDSCMHQPLTRVCRFTMIYHFSLNWEEHWHGDIYFFERDVQMNGWDDEGHGHH